MFPEWLWLTKFYSYRCLCQYSGSASLMQSAVQAEHALNVWRSPHTAIVYHGHFHLEAGRVLGTGCGLTNIKYTSLQNDPNFSVVFEPVSL